MLCGAGAAVRYGIESVAKERHGNSNRTARHAAGGRRGHTDRHGAAAAARRAEGGIRVARLL
ncbi:hypothetical protein BVI2075_180157 [Burkholderia vietnamiensis]|nr:hypothetical protein BVI2075_180157 [Burkholderia vietnamiensis]